MRAAGAVTAAACATSGALRPLRGAAVGISATVLAVTGHVLAGGRPPAPTDLALLLAAAWAVATALGGRRWGLPSLLAVLAGAQVVLHVGLAGATPVGAAGAGRAMAGMAGMAGSGGAAHGPWMLLAHLAAALLTAVLLRRGEDWLWALLELVTRGRRAPAAPPVVRAGAPLPFDGTVLAPLPSPYRSSEPRRGPPRGPAATAPRHA